MPVRLVSRIDEEPFRVKLTSRVDEDVPTKVRLIGPADEEEDTRTTWQKLLAAAGGGLLEGFAQVPEAVGRLSAVPTRLLGLEQEGEYAGADAPYEMAEAIRRQKPEQPEGAGYDILGGVAQAPGQAVKYGAALLGGGPLGAAAIIGAQTGLESYGGGESVGEAAKKAAIATAAGGILGKLAAAPLAGRIGGGALTGGAMAALEGGTPEEIAANAAGMGLLTGAFRAPKRSATIEEIEAGLGGMGTQGSAPRTPGTPEPVLNPRTGAVSTERPLVLEDVPVQLRGKPAFTKADKAAGTYEGIPEEPWNYPRTDAPEQVLASIQSTLDEARGAVDARLKPITWAKTEKGTAEFIRQNGTDPSRWGDISGLPGRDELAVRGNALRKIAVEANTERLRLEQALAEAKAKQMPPAAIDALEADLRRNKIDRAIKTVGAAGFGTEVARALQARRILTGALSWQDRAAIALTKRGKYTAEIGERLAMLPDDKFSEAADILREAMKPSGGDFAYELWIQGMLTSPMTQAVNTTSNALIQGIFGLERPVAAAISAVTKGSNRDRFFSEAAADLTGFFRSMPAAWKSFRSAASGNLPTRTKIEHPSAIGATVGGVPTPTTMLTAVDEFFKTIASARELHVQAYRKARLEGAGRQDAFAKMDEMLGTLVKDKNLLRSMREANEQDRFYRAAGAPRDPLADVVGQALKAGEVQTLTNEVGPIGKTALIAKEQIPGARWLLPFVQAPVNIAKLGWKRTPAGLAKNVWDAAHGRTVSPEDWAASTMGSAAGAFIAWQAAQGNVTGSGPSDPAVRKQWFEAGNLPYAIKLGEQWYSYQRLEPLATIFGLAADVTEAGSLEEQSDLVDKFRDSIAQNLTNKTFLQGVENFFEVLSDPQRYGDKFLQSFAGSVVPAGVAATARAVDPVYRDVTVGNVVQSRLPGASQELPPRFTVAGEPAMRSQAGIPVPGTGAEVPSWLVRLTSPVQTNRPGPEGELQRVLAEAGITKQVAQKTQRFKVPGTRDTYESFKLSVAEKALLAEADRKAAEVVLRMSRSPQWALIPSDQKKKYIDTYYDKFRSPVLTRIKLTHAQTR